MSYDDTLDACAFAFERAALALAIQQNTPAVPVSLSSSQEQTGILVDAVLTTAIAFVMTVKDALAELEAAHAGYAPIDHTHDYAPSDHTHDYAPSDHDHDDSYAAIDHTHEAS